MIDSVVSRKSYVVSLKKIFRLILFFTFTYHLPLTTYHLFAQEITILYSGETHAMIYPCSCPKELDGGIARRATLIKQLKKEYPHTLILESGGFFAGGLRDEYTQNTELDKIRTKINLKAMELMGYDAAAIGDDEFNFGKDFLMDNIAKINIAFLSCNIKAQDFRPYLIKEIGGIKIGIVAVTPLSAMSKSEGLQFIDPKIAVKGVVEELKKSKVNVIVLLSHLDENEGLRLIKEIPEINIIITGQSRNQETLFTKIGNTLLLRPPWQGRRLGKISFSVQDNKIIHYKVEELRLSDEIRDDSLILSILPRCFSDADCKKKGFIGVCQNPGSANAACLFSEPTKINLLIITPKECTVCNTEIMKRYLNGLFPGIETSYLYYPGLKANKLIKDFAIKGLPVYLLGKEIEKEKNFDKLRENIEVKEDFYMLKPQFSGLSYFLERERIKGRLDLFISLYNKDIKEILEVIREFNPRVHFLAIEQKEGFDAARGNLEVEEYLRAVCIKEYYPQIFWDYIICRGKSINSSWWEDCLDNLDAQKIKTCARSKEGNNLLKENISLNKELQIMSGPTYLLDNQETFGTQGIPKKEELRKIIKR